MKLVRDIAADLKAKHVVISEANARKLANEQGLMLAREGRRWTLYRADGLGHPVLYRHLVEVLQDLTV